MAVVFEFRELAFATVTATVIMSMGPLDHFFFSKFANLKFPIQNKKSRKQVSRANRSQKKKSRKSERKVSVAKSISSEQKVSVVNEK